jgi:hypothetical protein
MDNRLIIEYNFPVLKPKWMEGVDIGGLEIGKLRGTYIVKLIARAEGDRLIFRNHNECTFYVNKNKYPRG